ncbi:lysylphosphatidylglycerol synthase transmembrane domain-containing protein [Pricia sp.]|uniref:lysylphosphatidylglycerol synthase transmembrane domain-containing protein n=1 Tax=Pricia sp. TaxID=2268138 RepID=UPI0035930E49
MAKWRKKGIALLKIAISLVLIYFVFTKVDFREVWAILQKSRPVYIGLALVFFIASKVFSAFRLNLYFHRLGVLLTQKSNLRLYLLGMFYNLFLPGGIGGDAYKGYIIRKKFEVGTKKVVAVLLLDRLSGMLLLFVYACLLAMGLNDRLLSDYRILFGLGTVLGILVFWLLNKRFFEYVFPVFWKSVGYSALVQGLQLASLYCILCALSVENHILAYLFVFLISSIVSVVPLTIGGIGSREVTFYYGALWLGLNQDTSIGISMTFFLITAIVSLLGAYFHLRKPELSVGSGGNNRS